MWTQYWAGAYLRGNDSQENLQPCSTEVTGKSSRTLQGTSWGHPELFERIQTLEGMGSKE